MFELSSSVLFCFALLLNSLILLYKLNTFISFILLIAYHITRPYAESFAATLIGVSTTMIVKSLITLFLNKYSFVGFYRKRPVVANISNAAFESWLLATTSGFIVMRALKLIVVVVFNLGRFDRPILAPGTYIL